MLPRKIIPAITMVRSFLILFALMLVNSSAFATPNNVNCSTTKMCATAGSDDSEPSLESVKRLEDIKAREAELYRLLGDVRREKATALASRPLHIGIIGFGRFGQFIAKSFVKHGHRVVASSRSDYTKEATAVGASYIPLSDPKRFLDNDGNGIDVLVVAVSILSFEQTLRRLLPHMEGMDMLVVDVLSVKEHPKQVMLDILPESCDILATHPMFGPDSGKNSWRGLNFVYERVRVKGIIDPENRESYSSGPEASASTTFFDAEYAAGIDRLERFLSIWE